MHDAPLLEVRNLVTEVRTRSMILRPVDGISFTVNRGETLGIVGESGSGKSMTGLSLLRLVPRPAARIAAGEILLDGEDLLQKSEAAMRAVRGRRLSMILQDPQTSLNPAFTIGNQIMEALTAHKTRERRSLVDRAVTALREVRVSAPEQRIHDYPHQLSGGMRQRAVGAIAISCRPDLIIADEPTTSLDVTVQAQYLKLLRNIQEESRLAIIFITHDFGIVAKLCHRLLVMYAGRIVESGSVREIFNAPSHPYTEALLNSVPAVERRTERLYSISGQPPKLFDLPRGCRFAPRCAYAEPRCLESYPHAHAGLSGAADHTASCWKLENTQWRPERASSRSAV